MSNQIIVNYANPLWVATALTQENIDGIGTPYVRGTNTNEILFTRESLVSKLDALGNELTYWRGRESIGAAAQRRLFARRFYDLLFPGNTLSNRDTEIYWNTDEGSRLGGLRAYDNKNQIYRILNNHIDLVTQILNLVPNLARVPVQDTTPAAVESTLRVVGASTKTLTFSNITIETVSIPLGQLLQTSTTDLLTAKTLQFFDRSREYKTIVNFGNDRQYVAEAWRQGADPSSIQFKLLEELPSDLEIYDTAYIVRDIANPIIDTLQIEIPPAVDTSRTLRPYNQYVKRTDTTKQTVNEVTLTSLDLLQGSTGVISGSTISYEDRIFNQWYSSDFDSSELNIDFSDYTNFVSFGSAATRLGAFKNKLLKIESIGNAASVSSSNVAERTRAIERETIKRNFDAYERFLYYADNTPYSASAYFADGGTEYNPIGTWPKVNNIPVAVGSDSGSQWYATQSAIAERFDEFNPDYLVKHLPAHIQEDAGSVEFLTFAAMFGHSMDNLKVYIDQYPNIYSTSPDPYAELSMDQVYEVATSFGFNLPNAYAVEQLQSFISTTYNGVGTRALVAETWKRFLHSAIYLSKTKGTRTAVDGIMNVFGISSPLVQLKESAYPSADNFVQSDELTYALQYKTAVNSSIRLPLVSASLSTDTVILRFNPEQQTISTLLNGDQRWAVDVVPHPSASKEEYGRIHIVSGTLRTVVATSSYFPLFSDDYTSIMLRSQSQDMTIIQTDGDQILYTETVTSGITPTLWNGTQFIYVGGSGSIQTQSFDGVVDDVLVWNEQITDGLFVKQAYDPGSYYGSSYSSSFENLYVHLSFSQPLASITSSATNESPYISASLLPLPTVGFTTASYVKIQRPIKQFVPVVGATAYSNNKVTVAPPPVFGELSRDGNGTPELSRTNSIKPVRDKTFIGGQDLVSFAVSPVDSVNQNIMRTMGLVNTNYLMGSPRKVRGARYTEVDALYSYYLNKYNYLVNPNKYIRYFKNVIAGPSEQIETMIPARASLVDGVVIESNILNRQRVHTIKSFRVDGSGTRITDDLINSASNPETTSLAGAYEFETDIPLFDSVDTTVISQAQTVYQRVNPSDITPLTSSLISENGGIAFVESTLGMSPSLLDSEYATLEVVVDSTPAEVPQTGYPRDPFVGIPASGSYPKLLDGEENTVIPFYDVPPRANFNDVGTTTYFHLSSGVYRFPSMISKYQTQYYLAKFTETRASPIAQEYASITLLNPTTVPLIPGRESINLGEVVYSPGDERTTTIKMARLFSLLGIEGAAGLRVTLERESDGVLLFDGVLDSDSDVNPYLLMQTTRGKVIVTITNETLTPITSDIRFNYFVYDPLGLIPSGYLPRHYRYSKSTLSAQLNRNYLGCRQVYCEGECPPGVTPTEVNSPWIITVSTNSSPVVNIPAGTPTQTGGDSLRPTRTSDDGRTDGIITFGGAGPLGDE
jgi:hypothetical protein